MRHFALLAAGMLAAGVLAPATAHAEETVRLNGRLYTCTNSCVVDTFEDGSWSITDCCGGRVRTRFILK